MDQLGGVDFTKGCYVGQEVVSRMEHRGTARTRAVPVRYDGAAPAAGAAVTAGDRQVGTMGSAAAGRALALLRLDRVAEAIVARRAARSAAACRSIWSSRTGRALPFPAKPKPPNESHESSRTRRRPRALSLAQGRCALRRLSRPGMGRAGIRRPRALRKAHARRLPGRPVVDHHPAQARQFPPRLRRFRSGKNRALPAGQDRTADAGRRHRAQPLKDRRRRALGAGLARHHGQGAGLFEAVVGFRRRQAEGQPLQDHAARCRRRPRSRARSPRNWRSAASNSAGRPSSTPSCRRSAWSTII